MNRTFFYILFFGILLFSACQNHDNQGDQVLSDSVWAVDLVRTLPDAQVAYIRSIETNWAGARKIAINRGEILSYRALVAPPDSARGWDVLLMTEYPDSAAWANREATFQEIFTSPEFVPVEPAQSSAEMRVFMSTNVYMHEFISESK